ncbi:hypothetical protein [Actinoplanes sp. NPDC051851]|uniref:hypothetical protein n=1 Tax=Actinoplanes sp. NPDC051851 TaxID=3154753 RepID=UPI003441BA05
MRQLVSALGPAVALAGLAIAGVLTFALATVEPGGPRTAAFIASENYVIWRLLVVLLVLMSLTTGAAGWARLTVLRRRYPAATLTPFLTALPLGILVTAALPWLSQRTPAMTWNMLSVRMAVVAVVVTVAAGPSLAILWMVRERLGRLSPGDGDQPADRSPGVLIGELLALRRTAGDAVGVLAAIISLTVVNTGQLRNTYLAAGASPADVPVTGVILYGAFFAALLAFLYLPVHARWRAGAEALRESLFPIPPTGRPDADWSDGRQRLSVLLLLDKGVPGVLGGILLVGSPFLVSLVGCFVPVSR